MSVEEKTVFPLMEAYLFGIAKGLAEDVFEIKRKKIKDWELSYTSSIRRGYMIELFINHGILKEFLEQFWTMGLHTQEGISKIKRYRRIKTDYEASRSNRNHM